MDSLSPVQHGRRIQTRLREAFRRDHPPEQTAASFAVGLFLTALPNLGASVVVLGVIGRRIERANSLALFGAVAVMNPLAKGTVYVLSFLLGAVILGPVPGVTTADIGLSAGRDVLVRLLLGNAVLAVAFAAIGYGIALYGVYAARRYYN